MFRAASDLYVDRLIVQIGDDRRGRDNGIYKQALGGT
jgi:hypothetical protein